MLLVQPNKETQLFKKHESYSGVATSQLADLLKSTGVSSRILATSAGVGVETVRRMFCGTGTQFCSLDVADKLIVAANRLGILHGRLEEFLIVIPSGAPDSPRRMALDEWEAMFEGIEPDADWIERRTLALRALRMAVIDGLAVPV